MPVPFARVFVIPLVAALMLAMPASAGAKTYKVTLAARSCPTYADVSANLARNDIQESLQDLGPDTAYSSGQAIDPDIESANQPRCTPITGWEFRIGDGIAGQDVGAFGALSRVRNPSNRTIRTVASTPLFDEYGSNTGRRIAGAVNFNLNNGETNQAFSHSLWVQGGVPGDPVMDSRFPGAYGFAALRCAIDNLNGDNVEYVTFPSGTNHVFCFAYYVTPPPSSGTVIVRKEVTATGGDRHDASFIFDSNLTYDPSGAFSLAVSNNQPASTSFVRAQTRPGDDPWQVRERSMAGWELVSLDCVSADGTSSSTTSGASASISLAAGDTVTCTYVNRPVADGRLYVAKRSRLSTGRFAFAVTTPTNRNLTRSLTTRRPLLPATWATGLDELGTYSIREHLPRAPLGTWFNTAISCDGRSQPAGGAGPVVRATASLGSDGASAYCLFTNTFVPNGSITIIGATVGGNGALIRWRVDSDAGRRYAAAVRTLGSVDARAARTPRLNHLFGGDYSIVQQDITGGGLDWALYDIVCDGGIVDRSTQGGVTVRISAGRPHVTCAFINYVVPTTTPDPDPDPDPDPTPDPAPDPTPEPTPDPIAPDVDPVGPTPPARRGDPRAPVGGIATGMVRGSIPSPWRVMSPDSALLTPAPDDQGERARRRMDPRTRFVVGTAIRIPSLGVRARLQPIGRARDGRLEVPANPSRVGWWNGGALPGAPGATVLAGHVDGPTGPAVFSRLHRLHRGDMVTVDLATGGSIRYRVTNVRTYAKRRLPTRSVFGRTRGNALRLVTCGGRFDSSTGRYSSNVVVYAVPTRA